MNDFITPLYEFFFYSVPFSDDLYAQELYSILGISVFFISLVLAIIFYYIINRPAYSRWYHWIQILGINFLIAFAMGIFLPKAKFSAMGIEYHSEYYSFGLINGLISALLFLLISLIIRWRSTNAKGTPIPH